MYSMESGGQLLEGEQKLRRMRHYESETSIDYEERAGEGEQLFCHSTDYEQRTLISAQSYPQKAQDYGIHFR